MAVTNQLAALLVAGDPRGAADRTLAFLVSLNKARGAAVFALEGDRLTLFAGRGFDVQAVSAVQAGLDRPPRQVAVRPDLADCGRPRELRGRPSDRGRVRRGACSTSTWRPATDWTGLDTSSLTAFGVAIAHAVIAAASAPPAPSAVQAYLSQTSDEEIARERLLLLLVQNEWNISRVARLMGVTRRTIYLRLQRHNIVREKVRKTEVPSRRKAWSPA